MTRCRTCDFCCDGFDPEEPLPGTCETCGHRPHGIVGVTESDEDPLINGVPRSIRERAAKKAGCLYCARTRGHDKGCPTGDSYGPVGNLEVADR